MKSMVTCTVVKKVQVQIGGSVIMMTVVRRSMVVWAANVLGVIVCIHSRAAFLLGELILYLPGVWLDSDREFEILLGDRIPELRTVRLSTNISLKHGHTL